MDPKLRPVLCALLLGASPWFGACSSDATSGGTSEPAEAELPEGWTAVGDLMVDTGVSTDGPLAGDPVDVMCIVEGLAPEQPAPATSWAIIDAPLNMTWEPIVEGDRITLRAAGTYLVRCSLDETGWADPTPAKITVYHGPPMAPDTTVEPSVLVAGEVAEVTCEGTDAWDNPVGAGWKIRVEPAGVNPGAEGGLIEAMGKVKALVEGTYEVACGYGATYDGSPVSVTVAHGLPTTLVTILGQPTIVAGHQTSVTCRAEDKYGNEVPDLPMTVSMPDSVSLLGFGLTATLTGKYTIKCVPAGLEQTAFQLEHAVLEVLPDTPVDLELVPQPLKPFYPSFEVIQLVAIAHDQYGNPVLDAELDDLMVMPESTLFKEPSDLALLFFEEGLVQVTGTLVDTPEVSATVDLVIEGDPPSVAVTWPPRGATIQAWKPSVTVKGIANDTITTVASVRVNGSEAQIQPNGDWTKIVVPVWGLNLLEVEAEDEAGQITTVRQSFYFAEIYYPNDPQMSFVPDAIKIWLDQVIIDDGVHDPGHPNDLATVLEQVLANFNLNAVLGEPIEVGGGYAATLSNLTMNPPKLVLAPMTGGLHLQVDLKNIQIDVELKGECKVLGIDLCPDFSGDINIGKLKLDSDLYVEAHQGVMTSSLENAKVEIESFDIDIDGILGWLFDWLLDFVVDIFTGDIEDAFEDQLGDQLGDTLLDLFDALAFSQEIDLPSLVPGTPPISQTLETQIWSLAFTEAGGRLGLAARLDAFNKVPHGILGSIGRGSCLKGYPVQWALEGTHPYEIAIYDDFLNNVLTALWSSAILNVDLDEEGMGELLGDGGTDDFPLPVDALTLKLDWLLPPILNGCDPDGLLIIQVGDLFVDLDLYSSLFDDGLGEIGVYVYLEIAAELQMNELDDGEQTIGIQVLGLASVAYHWAQVPEMFEGAESDLEDLITDELLTKLIEQLGEEPLGNLVLPELDLASLSDDLPEGAPLVPVVDEFTRDSGHTLIEGFLE